MTPTNTDLAAALREIADTLPLGSALVVRLAADRLPADMEVLGEHDPDVDPWETGDGWFEWKSSMGKYPYGATVRVRFKDGSEHEDDDPYGWSWQECGSSSIIAYRVVA